MKLHHCIYLSLVMAGVLWTFAMHAQELQRGSDSRPAAERTSQKREGTPPFDDRADRPPRPQEFGPEGEPRHPPVGGFPRPPRGFDGPPPEGDRPPRGGFGPPGYPSEPGGQRPPRPIPSPPAALEKYDPELYQLLKDDQELERQTADLAMRWRRAPREEREALQKELTEAVDKHFDLRQQRRRLQLKRLEEELQALRDAIEKRDAARQDVIQQRVSELLGTDDHIRF